MKKCYNSTIEELVKHYATDIDSGLLQQEAENRLQKNGLNKIPEKEQTLWTHIFIAQFQSPLVYILLAAAIIIFLFAQDPLDGIIISGVLFFNAIIGTIQEVRTERLLYGLPSLLEKTVSVIRDGKKTVIDDSQLVVGDIIHLAEGQRVPADARIILADDLYINESLLTGESEPSKKTYKSLYNAAEDLPLVDQVNILFCGTTITRGYCTALVVSVGLQTALGIINQEVIDIKTEMPLQKDVDRLAYMILFFILFLCSFLFMIGFYAEKPLSDLFVMLIALFICVVPEGLPVVLMLVLATGVYQLSKKNIIVKSMAAAEAMGRITALIIDKTGTLTRNEMMVNHAWTAGQAYDITGYGYESVGSVQQLGKSIVLHEHVPLTKLATACALLSEGKLFLNEKTGLYTVQGNHTDAALLRFAEKSGIHRKELLKHYKEEFSIPFTPTHKYQVKFFSVGDKSLLFIIGAPEIIIQRLAHESQSDQIKQTVNTMTDQGLRALAVAAKEYSYKGFATKSIDEKILYAKEQIDNLHLLGVVSVADSIREHIKPMIEKAKNAGIAVIMATGDHEKTARYIAEQTGILEAGNEIKEGSSWRLNDGMISKKELANTTVYARVSPDQKSQLVQQYQRAGFVVAMTGDGINDAPSLSIADVGITMGKVGSEIAKQAADIILLDDSFAYVIGAIKQGRHIFYTLRRIVVYFFATNMGEVLVVFFALVMNAIGYDFPLPITAAQILWLNLVTDGFLDVALAMEPQEENLLDKSWHEKKGSLVDWNTIWRMFFIALPMSMVGLVMFLCYYTHDLALARTMTLVTLVMFQWFNAWNCRSLDKSILTIGFFSNIWLIAVSFLIIFLQMLLVYAPFMQYIFKTVPLTIAQWVLILGVSLPTIIIEEVRKKYSA